jgi:antitoxin (DNA-binding transcriptional repressor) of toxin-antitoxin stability system
MEKDTDMLIEQIITEDTDLVARIIAAEGDDTQSMSQEEFAKWLAAL